MIKTIRTIVLLSLALGAFSANAMPIKWDFNGTCAFNCGVIGLAPGGSVSGVLESTQAAILDGTLSSGDLTNFGFAFGGVSITPTSHVALGAFGVSSANGSLTGGMTFQSFFTGATTLSVGSLSAWSARVLTRQAFGAGAYTVPEPSTVLLLGLGLLAVGFLGRRRKKVKPCTG